MSMRNKRRFLKCAVALLLAVLVTAVTGCDAKVNLYVYATETDYVEEFEIRIPDSLRKELEATAAPRQNGERWTLADWVRSLAAQTQLSYEGFVVDQSDFVVKLSQSVPLSQVGSSEGERKIKNYFFFYVVEQTSPNPFNGLREQYDSGEGVMGYVSNGWESGGVSYPSLTQAFPAAADYDPSLIKLNLYLALNDKVRATGTWVEVDGVRYCLFERSFDDKQLSVTYRYYAANSLGWNVTALVAAAAVVAVILAATRKAHKAAEPDAGRS